MKCGGKSFSISHQNSITKTPFTCFTFFCLVLWEQFPCFSLWISWMPLCNVFLSVLIFDLYYFSLLYKDDNLYIYIIVWNFIVVFYTVCFLKVFYASLGAFKIIVYVLLKFYMSLCMLNCCLCVFKLISKVVCYAYMNC